MTRYRHGLVLGKFYPLHAGHASLLAQAVRSCERVTVQVLGSSVETISVEARARWVQVEQPSAHVVTGMDDGEVDFDSAAAWDHHMGVISSLLDEPVDAVFTSDPYGAELGRRLGASWVQVDPGRVANPVSGSAVRADLAGWWWALPPQVRADLVVRVVVLGAESTGSTTLAEALAAELGTLWVPEYGREYSMIRPGGLAAPWRSDEFDLVVERQLAWERDAALAAPTPLLVCDTDVLATALWHERYVGRASPSVLAAAQDHRPALYVLTGDEIGFHQDGWRDGEHIRHEMQQRFREVLAAQPVPWLEVRGSVAERVAAARPAIEEALAAATTFGVPLEYRGRSTATGAS